MARKEVERQLQLFGVGDLGPPDEDADTESGISNDARWQEVYKHLGKLLAEDGFADYLARRERGQDQPGDRR